jgi:hypothetical protein
MKVHSRESTGVFPVGNAVCACRSHGQQSQAKTARYPKAAVQALPAFVSRNGEIAGTVPEQSFSVTAYPPGPISNPRRGRPSCVEGLA